MALLMFKYCCLQPRVFLIDESVEPKCDFFLLMGVHRTTPAWTSGSHLCSQMGRACLVTKPPEQGRTKQILMLPFEPLDPAIPEALTPEISGTGNNTFCLVVVVVVI